MALKVRVTEDRNDRVDVQIGPRTGVTKDQSDLHIRTLVSVDSIG